MQAQIQVEQDDVVIRFPKNLISQGDIVLFDKIKHQRDDFDCGNETP